MITTETAHRQEQLIERALTSCSSDVKRTGPGQWRVSLSNGTPLDAEATLEENWLSIRGPVSPDAPAQIEPKRLWDLLQWNGQAPGGAKLAVGPPDKTVHARAECLLGDGLPLSDRLGRACEGLRAAHRKLHGLGDADDPSRQTPADPPAIDLAELCQDTGWPAEQQSAGLVAQLDVPGGLHKAAIAQQPNGDVSVSTEMLTCDSLSAQCQRAMGLLILTAGYRVRMVRGVARQSAQRTTVGFEVILDGAPRPLELVHAFSALSVACGLCAREAAALQDKQTAARYWSVFGWSK